jgi:hypothetical protein
MPEVINWFTLTYLNELDMVSVCIVFISVESKCDIIYSQLSIVYINDLINLTYHLFQYDLEASF